MNHARFLERPAGQVVKVGQGDVAYRAFVPNPLPPELAPDAELMGTLSDASYALGELAALGRSMANPHLLISPFVRREAVLSSRIEGTQASVADLYAYEAGQLPIPGFEPSPPESDVREVANYVVALEYGLQRLSTLPVSLRLTRELHERLRRGVRGEHATPGEFRRSQNWIGRPGCSLNQALFVPPPVPEMESALDAFEKYLHAEDREHSPLVRLAFIHYQFEAIHPFLDGNGRIGRLLISLLLVSWNLLPLPLLYLSAYFERERDRYYNALLAVSERGAWREWVLFFLQGVAEQARDAGARARRLEDLRATWRERLIQARSSSLPLALVDALFTQPVITIPKAEKLLGVTYRSAQLNVEKLVAAGILRQVGTASYGKTYLAGEILRIVSEHPA
ncbi:MAG: Fic family protein [Chloroflexi bacterium]|nr:Fic family protein [Chloroflexota bacterium]